MSKKTIKELAEEIGVSKTAISKKITDTQKKNWFTKIGNQIVISEKGQTAIKSMFEETRKGKSQTSYRNNTNQVSDSYFYQEQLIAKDKQIDMLQILLKEQQTLLDQQQRLTLQTNKQIEQLQLESSKNAEENTSQKEPYVSNPETEEKKNTEISEVKKGFFNRLFNKKE